MHAPRVLANTCSLYMHAPRVLANTTATLTVIATVRELRYMLSSTNMSIRASQASNLQQDTNSALIP